MLELLAILTSIAFCTAWFYRNPARTTSGGGAIYSPADGTIIAVNVVEKGRVPLTRKSRQVIRLAELLGTEVDGDGLLVAVFMSPLDVHVNRAPISGRVVFSKRIPGRHLFMRSGDFEVRNERHTTILQNDSMAVGVVQIAAPIAGCIETYVKLGDTVSAGQPIGRIALGSQVDLLIPRSASDGLLVSVGSRAKAGETIIAALNKQLTRNAADSVPFIRTTLGKMLTYYFLANLTVPAIMLILLRKIRAKLKMTQMHEK